MSAFTVSLQNQITALDAQLASISPTSVTNNGTSVTNPDWIALSKRRVELETLLNQASATTRRANRGVVTGLR
jgi:hypothetical protein